MRKHIAQRWLVLIMALAVLVGTLPAQAGDVIQSGTWAATLQSGAGATGNGASMDVGGLSTITFTVSGTFVATVTFEGTADNTNWTAVRGVEASTGTAGTTMTAPGVVIANCAGFSKARARVSAWTSGSVVVTARATLAKFNDAGYASSGGGDFIKLSEQTLSGTAATVTFTGISQNYKQLELRFLARSTSAAGEVGTQLTLNGSTTGYSYMRLFGNTTPAATSDNDDSAAFMDIGAVPGSTGTANVAGFSVIKIGYYTQTTYGKPIMATAQCWTPDAQGRLYAICGSWNNTAPVTSAVVAPAAGAWAVGGIFTLYGSN